MRNSGAPRDVPSPLHLWPHNPHDLQLTLQALLIPPGVSGPQSMSHSGFPHSLHPCSPQNSLSEEIANMKKLQDELLLNKVGRGLEGRVWKGGALRGGPGKWSRHCWGWNQPGWEGLFLWADSDLTPPIPSHRSSSWRRWSECRWRSTSCEGGHHPPTPGGNNFPVPSLHMDLLGQAHPF